MTGYSRHRRWLVAAFASIQLLLVAGAPAADALLHAHRPRPGAPADAPSSHDGSPFSCALCQHLQSNGALSTPPGLVALPAVEQSLPGVAPAIAHCSTRLARPRTRDPPKA